jgi:polyisoprenyl-teichoic acid--peptidoglycan teichoic acid transferase
MNRRPRSPNGFAIVLLLGLFLLVLTGIAFVFSRIAAPLAERVRDQIGTPLPPLVLSEIGGWRSTERVTVLLLGIDQRPDEDPANTRTDTMMLLTLDPRAKTAGMLSIPRDLYVPLPDRGPERINAAHVFGGAEYAMRSVEYNLGISVNHYVRVNFNALTTIIDLLGGVEVYNERDIDDPLYPDNTYGYEPFKLKAGLHTLDGKTALKYARTRHGDSDFYRIRRQQQVIMALREKFLGSDALTKVLPNLPAILQTLNASISTDLSNIELVQLILLAKDIPKDRIARVAIDETAVQPFTTPAGGQVVVPIRERLAELRDAWLNPVAAADRPETGNVVIQNGTQTRGLAARAQALLTTKGYTIAAIADAPESAPRTIVLDKTGKRKLAAQLAKDIGVPNVVVITAPEPGATADVIVVLGDDFARVPTVTP